MRFKISIEEQSNHSIIHITDSETGCSVEIYSYGALLNQFSILLEDKTTFNIKESFLSIDDAKARLTTWFNGARLSPFVCRLRNGKYSIGNQSFKIEKFYMGNHAIHGLVFDASYKLDGYDVDNEKASVTLHYHYAAEDKGYPFIFDSYITYTLSKDNIICILSEIKNASEIAIPFNEGWHPYFNLEGNCDEWELKINSNTAVEFDTEMIPTGVMKVDKRFYTLNKIGDTHLDDCYFIYDNTTPAAILCKNGITLSIYPSESMPYLQVFTPEHRKNIAIECLSSTPNSFNNKFGLVWIQPNETVQFETKYQLKKEVINPN